MWGGLGVSNVGAGLGSKGLEFKAFLVFFSGALSCDAALDPLKGVTRGFATVFEDPLRENFWGHIKSIFRGASCHSSTPFCWFSC